MLKECFEIQALALENVEVPEAIEDGLGVLFLCVFLPLELRQEPEQVIDAHDAVLRVGFEQSLHVLRRFRRLLQEHPPETEADSEGLVRRTVHDESAAVLLLLLLLPACCSFGVWKSNCGYIKGE